MRRPAGWKDLTNFCDAQLAKHSLYIREHLEDLPEVRDWTWRG